MHFAEALHTLRAKAAAVAVAAVSQSKKRKSWPVKKNIAVVQLDRPVEDTDLRTAVARAGFTVAGIEQMEA